MNDTLKVALISLTISLAVLFGLGPVMLKLQTPASPLVPANATAVDLSHTGLSQSATAPTMAVKPPVVVAQTTPNLKGIPVAAARKQWREQGIIIIEDTERIDPSVASGTILEQIPSGGAPLEHSEIHVTVAKMPKRIAVPDVVGKSLPDARTVLLAAGFEVPDAVREASDAKDGTVIRQEPNANAMSEKGALARIFVSQEMIEVPDLTGMRVSKAKRLLQQANLKLGGIKQREHEEISGGRILSQTPKAGSKVATTTVVDLIVVAPD